MATVVRVHDSRLNLSRAAISPASATRLCQRDRKRPPRRWPASSRRGWTVLCAAGQGPVGPDAHDVGEGSADVDADAHGSWRPRQVSGRGEATHLKEAARGASTGSDTEAFHTSLNHSPLEESVRQGLRPQSNRWGATESARSSDRSFRPQSNRRGLMRRCVMEVNGVWGVVLETLCVPGGCF